MAKKVDEYGYEEEGKEKSWLDLIIEYLKSKRESSKPKLKEVA